MLYLKGPHIFEKEEDRRSYFLQVLNGFQGICNSISFIKDLTCFCLLLASEWQAEYGAGEIILGSGRDERRESIQQRPATLIYLFDTIALSRFCGLT